MGCLAYKCLLFLCMDKRACEHTYFFHACMCMPVHTHEQQMGGFSQVLLQQTHHHCMYAGVHTMLSSIWRWRNLASIAVCRCINSWALTSKARSTVTKEQKQYYWHSLKTWLQSKSAKTAKKTSLAATKQEMKKNQLHFCKCDHQGIFT